MEGIPHESYLLPTMYGDHHVVKVRQIVAALPGVASVYASAAQKKLTVSFDPAKLTAEAIAAALAQGGYPPGASPSETAEAAADQLQHVAAAEQADVREAKYSPPPDFGVCPGLEIRYVGSEHPADRK